MRRLPIPNAKRAAALVALAAAAAAGCSTGAVLKERGAAIQATVKQAVDLGSPRCMPRETAVAQAESQFGIDEASEGNYFKAEEHLAVAKKNADAALEFARRNPEACMPVKVVIKTPPKPVVIDTCKMDSDRDGIADCEDKCPNDPGALEFNGCPPPDRDGDGIPDPSDKCPDTPGLPQYDGCPDSDGDLIADNIDRCPIVPGTPQYQGCPDTDTDSIPDPDDKCPYEPGVANLENPEKHGCKAYTLVVVKKGIIEIKEQVHFETGKAIIKEDSFELLRQVALVLKDNPQFKVEVQGHTDNVGGKAYNKNLSDKRAKSVREHLIKKEGIDADRLQAKGYGMERPIASNATAKGKAANRRVEFRIIGGQDSGEPKPEEKPPEPEKPKPKPKKKFTAPKKAK